MFLHAAILVSLFCIIIDLCVQVSFTTWRNEAGNSNFQVQPKITFIFFYRVFWCPFWVFMVRRAQDGPSSLLMCLRRWGQCHLLELALEKSNWCHICCTAVLSHYKMWEVLITLPTCLAYYPSQLSKELVNIRLDSQPTFLLFSNSSNVILPKDFSLTIFFLCSPKNWKIIFAINTPISQILRIRHILAKYLT